MAYCHLRERMLLASARGLQDGDDTEIQCGVLAGQVRQERGARQEGACRAGGGWLACSCAVGMRDAQKVDQTR